MQERSQRLFFIPQISNFQKIDLAKNDKIVTGSLFQKVPPKVSLTNYTTSFTVTGGTKHFQIHNIDKILAELRKQFNTNLEQLLCKPEH